MVNLVSIILATNNQKLGDESRKGAASVVVSGIDKSLDKNEPPKSRTGRRAALANEKLKSTQDMDTPSARKMSAKKDSIVRFSDITGKPGSDLEDFNKGRDLSASE